jgi:hypothetical protein
MPICVSQHVNGRVLNPIFLEQKHSQGRHIGHCERKGALGPQRVIREVEPVQQGPGYTSECMSPCLLYAVATQVEADQPGTMCGCSLGSLILQFVIAEVQELKAWDPQR